MVHMSIDRSINAESYGDRLKGRKGGRITTPQENIYIIDRIRKWLLFCVAHDLSNGEAEPEYIAQGGLVVVVFWFNVLRREILKLNKYILICCNFPNCPTRIFPNITQTYSLLYQVPVSHSKAVTAAHPSLSSLFSLCWLLSILPWWFPQVIAAWSCKSNSAAKKGGGVAVNFYELLILCFTCLLLLSSKPSQSV